MGRFTIVSSWVLGSALLTVGLAVADDKPADGPEKVLLDKGYTKDDKRFLLDEAPALAKLAEARSAYKDYQQSVAKSSQIAAYDQNVAAIDGQRQAVQQQANALQQQINASSSGGYGKMRRMMSNQTAPMRQMETQLKNQVTQLANQHKAMQAQGPKPDQRKVAASDFDRTQQAYKDSVRGLESLVTPLMAKYHELALDKEVVDALAKLNHQGSAHYKLGPSDELRAAAKLVKDLGLAPHKTKAVAKKAAKP